MKSARFVFCLVAILFTIATTSESSATEAATSTTFAVTSGGVAVSNVPAKTVVTLTAAVHAGGTAVQLGTVNFCDASAKSCTDIHLLGTAQLTSAGTASMKLRPGIGTHSYKAIFLGTKSNAASSSLSAALTVTAPAVTGPSPTTTTLAASGVSGNYTLTAAVNGPIEIASPTGTVSFEDTSDGNYVLDTAPLGIGTQGFSWLHSQNIYTYGAPQAVAAGDFNGDGLVDLASAGNSGVTFLLGNGDGTFTAKSSVDGCSVADSIALADYNADGIPDMAVTCPPEDAVKIYLGHGDGTFTFKSSSSTGNWPNSVVSADLNGDGILDLAVANAPCCGSPFTPYLTILLGNGDGTFKPAPNAPAPGLPWGVLLGDFNGDGIPDLAFSNSYSTDSSVSILLGNGDGTFTAAPSLAAGNGPGSVFLGDFNGDGKEDAALAYADGHGNIVLKMMLGNGDGTFTAVPVGPVTLPYSAGFLPGDFDGDGVSDFFVMNTSNNTASLLLGKGDGTFTTTPATPSPFSQYNQNTVADFNGDGISDMASTIYPVSGTTVPVVLTQPRQTATATANGIAVLGGSADHQVKAIYSGDTIHQGSSSGTVALTPLIKPTQLVFTTPPAGTLESDATPGTVKVSLEDADGNVAFTSNTGTVTLIVKGPNYYDWQYGKAVVSGVATFDNLAAVGDAGTYTYTATDTPDGVTQAVATQQVLVLAPQGSYAAPTTNVGSTGAVQTATLVVRASGTLNKIDALTQGAANLDFQVASGGTCSVGTAYTLGQSCSVNFKFSPLHPGSRLGAIQLTDSSSNAMATAYISGVGVGPSVTFANPTSGNFVPSRQTQIFLSIGVWGALGVTVDASGNIFFTDGNRSVVNEILAVNGSIPASPTIKTLGSGFWFPEGVAVDGAGNVFVADKNNGAVKEIVAAGGYTTVKTLGHAFPYPVGVAVDGSGNVFVADWYADAVYEILAAGGYTTVNALAGGSHFGTADNVALDADGNVYVAAYWSGVTEIPAASGYTTVNSLVSGAGAVSDVVPDSGGNLYVTDRTGAAKEILAAGGYTIVKTLATGFSSPNSLALDASGNVIVADTGNGRLVKLDYADPPSLYFARTAPGVKSSDSPQSITVSNIGNADLTIPAPASGNNPSLPSDFTLDAKTTCPEVTADSAAGTLGPGKTCIYAVDFLPVQAGVNSGSLLLTDNHLNAPGPAYATQSVPLSGTVVGQLVVVGTSPQGLAFTVDGTAYTSTQTFTWMAGTAHTLSTTAQQGAGSNQYHFTGWNDGTPVVTDKIVVANDATYTASFTTTAVPVQFQTFSAAGCLQLNGSAKLTANALQLTDGGATEAGTAFCATRMNVQSFTTDFTFQLANAYADGLMFVIQNQGAGVRGGPGSGLGFQGIPRSVGIKFDLWSNAGEGNNSTGLFINGAPPTSAGSIDLTRTGINLHSGNTFAVHMAYDGATLAVTIMDTLTGAVALQRYPIDIPATIGATSAYVGFTAATGGLTAGQNILTWSFAPGSPVGLPASPTFSPAGGTYVSAQSVALSTVTPGAAIYYTTDGTVPSLSGGTPTGTTTAYTSAITVSASELVRAIAVLNGRNSVTSAAQYYIEPSSYSGSFAACDILQLNGSATLDAALQLTDGSKDQRGSAFCAEPMNVQSFTSNFNFQLTDPNADGFMFVIQSHDAGAVGYRGSGLGFQLIPKSAGIKFDLYDNAGEGNNSTGLYVNGAAPTVAGSINLSSTGINLHSGDIFAVHVTYDGTTLTVKITDTETSASATQNYTVDIPALVGGSQAYVGFTGSTGGGTAIQQILNWSFTPTD